MWMCPGRRAGSRARDHKPEAAENVWTVLLMVPAYKVLSLLQTHNFADGQLHKQMLVHVQDLGFAKFAMQILSTGAHVYSKDEHRQ